jgi:menaquinone-dependent protoporphyrinogen oxidase
VEHVTKPENYEAFVIGSAVYYGSWLKEATDWTLHNRNILTRHPVWFFSSGPLGNEVTDADQQPKEMAEFREAVAPRDQRIFFGSLDPVFLSFPERMMVKAVRAPRGDFRDWEAIDSWAESIARNL